MKKIEAYCCDFCDQVFTEKEKAAEHEKLCTMNPRHACCENCAAHIAGKPPVCRFGIPLADSSAGKPVRGLCEQWQAKIR